MTLAKDVDVELVLKKAYPQESYKNVIEDIMCGDRKAAIKLKCLDCSGHQREEVRNCPIVTCALWSIRPYQ